jgi:hypothetical protein
MAAIHAGVSKRKMSVNFVFVDKTGDGLLARTVRTRQTALNFTHLASKDLQSEDRRLCLSVAGVLEQVVYVLCTGCWSMNFFTFCIPDVHATYCLYFVYHVFFEQVVCIL